MKPRTEGLVRTLVPKTDTRGLSGRTLTNVLSTFQYYITYLPTCFGEIRQNVRGTSAAWTT
jgi:site-specific recombinase XerC